MEYNIDLIMYSYSFQHQVTWTSVVKVNDQVSERIK